MDLPKERRIRLPVEFRRVMKRGRAFEAEHLVILALPNSMGRARLGVSIRRKVCGSVCRNRLKRWIRESFRTEVGLRQLPLDVVVVVRRAGAGLGFKEIKAAFQAFTRLQGRKLCAG
ncbi:MAG: ribonuclease P protein component [bacterium]